MTTDVGGVLPSGHTDITFAANGDLVSSFTFFSTHSFFRRQGFTSTIIDSIDAPAATPTGIAMALGVDVQIGGNTVSVSNGEDKIYVNLRFTETVLESWDTNRTENGACSLGDIEGEAHLTFDNGNGGVDRWTLGTSTLEETLTNGLNFAMHGTAYEREDDFLLNIFKFGVNFFMRRYVGFSFTFDSDINEPATSPKAFAHFVSSTGGTRRQRQIKSLIRSRNRRRSH